MENQVRQLEFDQQDIKDSGMLRLQRTTHGDWIDTTVLSCIASSSATMFSSLLSAILVSSQSAPILVDYCLLVDGKWKRLKAALVYLSRA